MSCCFSCFGPSKEQRQEEDRLASEEARARAAEAAQKRKEQFDNSAAGRAARAQIAATKKQSDAAAGNRGEPVLKVLPQMNLWFKPSLLIQITDDKQAKEALSAIYLADGVMLF